MDLSSAQTSGHPVSFPRPARGCCFPRAGPARNSYAQRLLPVSRGGTVISSLGITVVFPRYGNSLPK